MTGRVWGLDEQAYVQLCRRHGLTALAGGEIKALVEALVDAGLAAPGRRGVYSLAVPVLQVTAALEGNPLIAGILATP